MKSTRRTTSITNLLKALLIIMLMLVPQVPVTVTKGFVTDSGFQIEENSTLVSVMKKYSIIGPKDLTVMKLVPGQSKLILAGTGYVSLVDLTTTPPDIVWADSIIGKATALAVDDSYSPEWYVVGTDAGEILAINAKNPDFRKSYFTAGRSEITRIGVGTVNGESTLFVLDNEGYLYIYKLPESGWFEIGDNPQNGPVGSLANFNIHDASMPVTFRDTGFWYYDPSMIAAIVNTMGEGAYGGVVLYPYYKTSDNQLKPAVPQQPTELQGNENMTIEAHLYYGVIYYPYNFISELKEVINATIIDNNLYPVKQSLFVAYVVTVKDKITGETVNSTCYSTVTGAYDVKPGQSLDLGRVILENHGETLSDCLSYHNIEKLEGVTFDQLLAAKGSTLPSTTPNYGVNGDIWMTLLWRPGDLPSIQNSYIFKYFQYESRPASWPVSATGLLAMGVTRYVYIYLVDSQLYPQEISTPYKYVEVVDVGGAVSTISSSPNGTSLFIGTITGKVLWLEWNSTLKRYVAKASLQVDSRDVTSISYLTGGYLLITTASGRIQLAELADNEMVPLWRGPYGYNGIETGLSNLVGEAYSANLIATTALQSSKSVFYVIKLDNLDIIRVLLTSNILYVSKEGSKVQPLPDGSKLEVYSATTGDLVAVVPANYSNFSFYLEKGSYIFNFYVPGLGYISKQVTVEFPEYKEQINFALREITVRVRVPLPAENETYPENVNPGPIENAIVSLVPVKVEPGLGMNVTPYAITGVTDKDGKVFFYVWDGVSYNLTVKAVGFGNFTSILPSWGPQVIDVQLKPAVKKKEEEKKLLQYYTVTINVVNDQAQPLKNAIVNIYDANNNLVYSSVTLSDGTITARLLEGTYRVEAKASGYLDNSVPLKVPLTGELTLALEPTNVTRAKRMLLYILILLGIVAIAAVFYAIRDRIARWLSEEEEYF